MSSSRRNVSTSVFDPTRVRTVLLISSTALGDTVLSTAAFGAIRRRYPDAHVVALVHETYAPLFKQHPDLDEVLPYFGGYRRFLRTALQLRKRKIDVALILHGNEPQATPLAYLGGSPFIFKLPNTSRFSFLLSNREPILTWKDFRHGIDQRLAVARLADVSTEGAHMRLPTPPSAQTSVATWLEREGVAPGAMIVGLQVGASSRSRVWPAPHFVDLAQRLKTSHSQVHFVLLGSPTDAAYAREIAAAIGSSACVAAGALPIEALPALVTRLAVVVTGDTGTLHVAVAVGTPTVGLFAVSDPSVSGPAYDHALHAVIYRPYQESAGTKSDDQRGMAAIDVAEVVLAVLQRLRDREPR